MFPPFALSLSKPVLSRAEGGFVDASEQQGTDEPGKG